MDLLARYKFIYKAKCPINGSTLPKVSGDIKEWRWGLELKKAKQYTLKASAPERTFTPLTFKKMEPRPYFNIKNALNGFTYNLVPEDH